MKGGALLYASGSRIDDPARNADRIHVRNAWRILPLLVLGYILNTLGKTNVGLAALEMNRQLHFSPSVFGLGAGLFFVSYTLCELPSNLILRRVGARFWLSRILITWGIVSAAMALISGPVSFYLLRILLGVAEAGWYPGVLFYLTLWFPRSFRARATMLFIMAVPISAVVGAPLSGALLDIPDAFGIHGWQWLFIVTGFLSILLGLTTLRTLKDSPYQASWLSPEEMQTVSLAVQQHNFRSTASAYTPNRSSASFLAKAALFCGVNFAVSLALFVTSFWLPKAIQANGQYDNFTIGLITAIPFFFAAVALVLLARSSDRQRERKWHVALPLLAAGGAMGIAFGAVPAVAFAMLIVAITGALGCMGVMYAMFSEELGASEIGHRHLAVGLAAITMAGNISGFVGSVVSGQIMSNGGGYRNLVLLVAASFTLAGSLVAIFYKRNRI